MASSDADKEKASSDANRSHDEGRDMPRDPDAHLSEAEKAEVVGCSDLGTRMSC